MPHLPATEAPTLRTMLQGLIATPSVSSIRPAWNQSNRPLLELLASWLCDAGFRVELLDIPGQPDKANLAATLGEGPGGLVLSGHTDTVPFDAPLWQHDPLKLSEDGGRLYGLGTADMKSFLGIAIEAARGLSAAALKRPLIILATADEESAMHGARALVEAGRPLGRYAVIGEPTGMQVIEGHKGCCEYTTEFQGLEGHGSAPHRGVNAVSAAVRYAARLMELSEALKDRAPEWSQFDPPFTTVNLGRIGGGSAHNVIAGQASLDWEMRPVHTPDGTFVKSEIDWFADTVLLPEMRAIHADAAIRRLTVGEVAGLEPTRANEARDIVAELTGANGAELVAFGTEAGLFQAMGMDCIVCGPGSIEQAHKPDEYLAVDQLSACLDMLEGLGRKLAA